MHGEGLTKEQQKDVISRTGQCEGGHAMSELKNLEAGSRHDLRFGSRRTPDVVGFEMSPMAHLVGPHYSDGVPL